MYALAGAHPAGSRPLLDGTPVRLLAALGLAALAFWTFAAAGVLSPALARAFGAGAAHGSLLACAVAWTVARHRGAERWPAGIVLAALAGAGGAAVGPAGALAYLLAPLWLWRRRGGLPGLGLDGVTNVRLMLAGAALGAVLGAHLMITASLTLRYRITRPAADDLAAWLAYDIGANVLAAECFFRGGVFDRAQRRWSFGTAAALSTTACVARYLVDPLLPRTLEVAAGAAFYLALLSVGNCWLYWRSGSVMPGLAAGCVFFAVYRLLHAIH